MFSGRRELLIGLTGVIEQTGIICSWVWLAPTGQSIYLLEMLKAFNSIHHEQGPCLLDLYIGPNDHNTGPADLEGNHNDLGQTCMIVGGTLSN